MRQFVANKLNMNTNAMDNAGKIAIIKKYPEFNNT